MQSHNIPIHQQTHQQNGPFDKEISHAHFGGNSN